MAKPAALRPIKQSFPIRDSPRLHVVDDDKSDGQSLSPLKGSRRIGGRARTYKKKRDLDRTSSTIPGWLKTFAAPLVALWVLSRLLFGGGESSTDYYYYQSSVYQSSVYGPDGRIDTSRKESVRSNIPELVDKKSRQRVLPSSSDGTFDYERRADDEFDRLLDQEIESMMRMQRNFLNDFW